MGVLILLNLREEFDGGDFAFLEQTSRFLIFRNASLLMRASVGCLRARMRGGHGRWRNLPR
jgi:hypothetical protein